VLVADRVLPTNEARSDLAETPRRALAASVQAAALLAIGVPVLALSAPFVPSIGGVGVVLLVAVVGALAFRRRVDDLDGHFRAGSQVVLEALVRQSRGARPTEAAPELDEVIASVLPGLGKITAVRVAPTSAAIGQTLDELDLHGQTGATVVCIARGGQGWTSAPPEQALQSGDLLALTGSEEEVESAARQLRAHGDG